MNLELYIQNICNFLGGIPENRRNLLNGAVNFIHERMEKRQAVHLTFICTHNSRRSHLAQAWCHVAARHYDVANVHAWSGGTEATACNIRTIEALRRAGLPITDSTGGENPVYLLEIHSELEPLRLYSKTYDTVENPQTGYAAMMCCSDVDESCPVIFGSEIRIPLHYRDPKESDDSQNESETYDHRCAEIATEMFYIMSKIAG